MAQESPTITGACEAFLKSLKEERYYDAHEDLEALWFLRRFEDDDEVKLWKGFINAAVCFELIKKRRPKSSETPWKTYLKYVALLEGLETEHKHIYVTIIQLIQHKRGELCPIS
ncbi:MAG: DUF309 domain-containing protein [Sulfuricurvum sp.]|nr:DUF309 domain-containing protein [Sulfuricurvum sp.]